MGFSLALCGFHGIRLFGIIIGTCAFDIFKYKKRVILYNLNVVYGDSLTPTQKIRLGRKSMINYATTLLEIVASKWLFKRAHIEIINSSEIKRIQKNTNKGIYMVGVHTGNLELTFYVLFKNFIFTKNKIAIVANLNKGIAEKLIQSSRSRYIVNINKMNIIEKGLSPKSAIFDLLNKNGVVCFSIDHKKPSAENVLFFGQQTSINNSVARLFLRKNAPILPCVLTRTKPGYFKMEFFDEVMYHQDKSLSLKENVTQLTNSLNRIAEKIILKYPEEHWWWRNRWDI